MPYAELRNATKRYGPVTAVNGIDLTVNPSELVALLGPNGAGKTTAVRLMMGLTTPTSGEAKLFGHEPSARAARIRTGVMLQTAQLPDTLRVREQIELFSSYYPNPLPESEVLALAGLEKLSGRLCAKLSGGEKQRVAFAIAICGRPDLLFLDEPTTGLDVESRRQFWGCIRSFVQRGGSVLLTTHYLEEADALADRLVIIDGGRIVAEGTAQEVKARAASSRIRCVTALRPAEVATLPGVQRIATDMQRIEIFTAEPERVVRELLLRDASLSGLEVSASGLEDAFLAVTGEVVR